MSLCKNCIWWAAETIFTLWQKHSGRNILKPCFRMRETPWRLPSTRRDFTHTAHSQEVELFAPAVLKKKSHFRLKHVTVCMSISFPSGCVKAVREIPVI